MSSDDYPAEWSRGGAGDFGPEGDLRDVLRRARTAVAVTRLLGALVVIAGLIGSGLTWAAWDAEGTNEQSARLAQFILINASTVGLGTIAVAISFILEVQVARARLQRSRDT